MGNQLLELPTECNKYRERRWRARGLSALIELGLKQALSPLLLLLLHFLPHFTFSLTLLLFAAYIPARTHPHTLAHPHTHSSIL